MISSNVYFFLQSPALGRMELIGHAPLIVSALLFLFYGAGDKWRVPVPRPAWGAALGAKLASATAVVPAAGAPSGGGAVE